MGYRSRLGVVVIDVDVATRRENVRTNVDDETIKKHRGASMGFETVDYVVVESTKTGGIDISTTYDNRLISGVKLDKQA